MTLRQFHESGLSQGTDEQIPYYYDAPSGSAPANPVVTVLDMTTGVPVDVTVAKTSGVASIVGLRITTPLIIALVPAHLYRLELRFTTLGATLEYWCNIAGEL